MDVFTYLRKRLHFYKGSRHVRGNVAFELDFLLQILNAVDAAMPFISVCG